jgi:predicted phosphodiesterase
LSAISEWSYDLIKGNHEYILEDLMKDASIGESIRLKYGSGHQEAIDKLTKEQLELLKILPETKTVKFTETSLLMCHGSPWSNDFYIYPDADHETLLKCDSTVHDFVLIGHSHYQFAIRNKKSMLVNPGSVGQSRQHGALADWCIINTENKSFQMLSTPYSTENLITEIAAKDKDINYLTKVLKRN